MSISDINRAMAMYAQPTEFDQQAWKTAFDISNAFNQSASLGAKAREDWRKYYFNQAVQETGINAQNALNRNTVNKADWETAFRNATEQNHINYTNWDYGNKQQVGDLKLQDLQRLYNNVLQTDPSQIASTIAQNNYNANNYGFQNSQLDGNSQILQAQREMQTQGIYPTLENTEAYMKQNPTKFNEHAFGALAQQIVSRENQHKKGFSEAVAMATEDIIDPLTGQASGKRINEQKLRTLLGGIYLDPTSHPIINERYRALAKDQGFIAPEYNIGGMEQGLYRFIGHPDYEKMLTPKQIEIGKTELSAMQEQAKSAVNDTLSWLNSYFGMSPSTVQASPQPTTAIPQYPQGVVINGKFIPANGEQKSFSDLLNWMEVEKARERGRHW